jgi:hypothetical protein
MKTTITLSLNLNCSPFEIFQQDTDEVILIINFYMGMGEKQNSLSPDISKTKPSAETRIRVNDKTATGGWF